jgi:hypothetical protein
MATSGPVFGGAVTTLAGGQGTWASTANIIGTDNNTLAVWSKPAATNQVSASLEVSSFGAFSDIPANSTINSVTVAVNQFNASTTRMLGGQYELWNAGTAQIGATQTGLNTTTTTNVDSAVITGVTQAQLSTLRVRVRARGAAANAQTSTGSVDYVSLTVNYTAPIIPATADAILDAPNATAVTADSIFANADLVTATVAIENATAVKVDPALPDVAAVATFALDATAQLVTTKYDRVYYVAVNGSNAGAGTQGQPLATITEAVTRGGVDNLADRSVLVSIQPGTYREQVIVPSGGTTQPFAIEASAPGVTISGSDISPAADWTAYDAPNRIYYRTWTQNWGLAPWPDAWEPQALLNGWTDIIRRREMVIVNGVWVRQVLTLAEIDDYDAAYFVDDAGSRLYLRLPTGGNINSDLIEVSTRGRCLEATDRANLQIRGLRAIHAATVIQTGALRFVGCQNLLVENCETRFNSYGGLGLAASDYNTGTRILNCHNHDNGVIGLTGYRVQNLLMEDSHNSRNNTYRGVWANYRGWEDGFKLLNCRSIVLRRCHWIDNNASGVWFDFDNKDVLIEDCVSRGNLGPAGIHFEYCQGPITIRRCKITKNFRGITGVHTSNITIEDCDIWDNSFEIQVASFNGAGVIYHEWDTGLEQNANPVNWTVINNRVWATAADPSVLWRVADQFAVAEGWRTTLTASGNSYFSTVDTTPFWQRNSNDTFTEINFTDWKTYLGGSRDSTSTFSSTAPTMLLAPTEARVDAYAQNAAVFVRPVGFVATAFNDDRIDLAWNGIDAASGYDIERDGVIIVFEVIPTTYSDIGLTPATQYSYRVRAARPGTG